jgi:hypothetical protein
MKKVLSGLMFAWLLTTCSGCGGGYSKAEEATKEMLSSMNDISAALESVKDKETAKAAAPKIEAAVERLKAATKKAEGVKGTQADKEKLEKEYMPKIQEASTRMMQASMTAAVASGGDPTFLKAIGKMKNLK